MSTAIPTTVELLERQLEDGLHVGAQIHVRYAGHVVADEAIGLARDGVPMTVDTSMIWLSTTKITTSIATAMAWERGAFDLDDTVASHLPAFGANGKGEVTIRQLLTHTAGFRLAAFTDGRLLRDVDESWDDLCGAPLEDGWRPGRRAGYHPVSSMAVLGKLVAHADGRPFTEFVRDEIFVPLGMPDCWIGMPEERFDAYGDLIGVMHDTSLDPPRPFDGTGSRATATDCVPGAGGRGPMWQLGRLMEMLRGRGALDGVPILRRPTVEAITARHRVGMYDETFGLEMDWGLGLIVDSIIYGRFASDRTYGHGGARSSVAFHDPVADVIVALVCNGMAPRETHYPRMAALCDAVYTDLGAADPASRRDRPFPSNALL